MELGERYGEGVVSIIGSEACMCIIKIVFFVEGKVCEIVNFDLVWGAVVCNNTVFLGGERCVCVCNNIDFCLGGGRGFF